MSFSPKYHYECLIDEGRLSPDKAQMPALNELETLYEQLQLNRTDSRGLYLWGQVGRGKTCLMDVFHQSLNPKTALRIHFHHFMKDMHQQLTHLTGIKDPLKSVAQDIQMQYSVICFDEFFVSDIADAMLLGRLMTYLFDLNVVIVMTSNCEPKQLYKDGLQRSNFLPAINAIYENMNVIHMDGKEDHRRRALHVRQNYFVYANSQQKLSVNNQILLEYQLNIETLKQECIKSHIEILGRSILVLAKDEKTIAFDFIDICQGTRSHLDYIEIAQQFKTIIVLNVPMLSGMSYERIKARGTEDGSIGSGETGEREVVLAPMDDAARRFIALIDECYDQKIHVCLSSEIELENLYQQGSLCFEFQRTHSRLIEMASEEYFCNRNNK